jgi:hypothetical protein
VSTDCTSTVAVRVTQSVLGYLLNVTYGKERMGNGVFGLHLGVLALQNYCDRGGRLDVEMRSSYVLVSSMEFLKFNYPFYNKMDQMQMYRLCDALPWASDGIVLPKVLEASIALTSVSPHHGLCTSQRLLPLRCSCGLLP